MECYGIIIELLWNYYAMLRMSVYEIIINYYEIIIELLWNSYIVNYGILISSLPSRANKPSFGVPIGFYQGYTLICGFKGLTLFCGLYGFNRII